MNQDDARADTLRHFAHDLKNPLTAVRVLCEMLVEDLSGQAAEDIADVVEAVDLCAAMADGLSDLARVEAGAEPTYEMERRDLATLVRTACERPAMRNRIELAELAEVQVKVDPAAAARALGAVLLNGCRTLSTGRMRVSVLPEGVVRIEHPGVRVDPSDAADLLQPYGASRLRARRVRASALGLAYARVTMEWLGGDLAVLPEESGLRVSLRFLT